MFPSGGPESICQIQGWEYLRQSKIQQQDQKPCTEQFCSNVFVPCANKEDKYFMKLVHYLVGFGVFFNSERKWKTNVKVSYAIHSH